MYTTVLILEKIWDKNNLKKKVISLRWKNSEQRLKYLIQFYFIRVKKINLVNNPYD